MTLKNTAAQRKIQNNISVSKQKTEAIPKQLAEYWETSLMNQHNVFHATASITDALEELNVVVRTTEKETRDDERNRSAEVETFAKEYAEKGVDETDQKSQAWVISQASAILKSGLSNMD